MRFLISVVLFLTFLIQGCSYAMDDHDGMHQHNYHGSHGMLMFGDNKAIYVSHLPLYRAPHDRQIIAPLTIKGENIRAFLQLMFAQNQLVTLLPESFDLRLLEKGSLELKATVFAGHFERGGQAMLKDVAVHIEKPLIWHELKQENASQDYYWQLNNGEASYLIHTIGQRPSFDFIAKLKNSLGTQASLKKIEIETLDINNYRENLSAYSYETIYEEYSDLK